MGINILFTRDGTDHPDWDFIRQVNDSSFSQLINWRHVKKSEEDPEEFRPTNISELRKMVKEQRWENADRYYHLLDLIENNPEYYLSFSW